MKVMQGNRELISVNQLELTFRTVLAMSVNMQEISSIRSILLTFESNDHRNNATNFEW